MNILYQIYSHFSSGYIAQSAPILDILGYMDYTLDDKQNHISNANIGANLWMITDTIDRNRDE